MQKEWARQRSENSLLWPGCTSVGELPSIPVRGFEISLWVAQLHRTRRPPPKGATFRSGLWGALGFPARDLPGSNCPGCHYSSLQGALTSCGRPGPADARGLTRPSKDLLGTAGQRCPWRRPGSLTSAKWGVHILHIEIMIAYCAYLAYWFAYFAYWSDQALHVGHIIWHIEHDFLHITLRTPHIGSGDISIHIIHIVLHIVHIILHIY